MPDSGEFDDCVSKFTKGSVGRKINRPTGEISRPVKLVVIYGEKYIYKKKIH